jgi:hypothetical protein
VFSRTKIEQEYLFFMPAFHRRSARAARYSYAYEIYYVPNGSGSQSNGVYANVTKFCG